MIYATIFANTYTFFLKICLPSPSKILNDMKKSPKYIHGTKIVRTYKTLQHQHNA